MVTDQPAATVAEVRGVWLAVANRAPGQAERFEGMLESVRAEERERIARNIEALPDVAIPGYFATRPGGYVTRTLAATIAREGA